MNRRTCSSRRASVLVCFATLFAGTALGCAPVGDDDAPYDDELGTDDGALASGEGITVVGTTSTWDSNGSGVTIDRPAGSRAGDLMVLVLHRTDDDLPLNVRGWNRVAECLKRDNGYDCVTADDCERWTDDSYCAWFGDRGREARDLAQAIFYRVVGASEPRSYTFEIERTSGGHPGWIVLTALRGADTRDPVRGWEAVGCDGDERSVFPSVYGERGDMLLLSQSFDDAIAESRFQAPPGTSLLGYVSRSDEAGFLFGGILSRSGETGRMTTRGAGGSGCKDALVSLTIRPSAAGGGGSCHSGSDGSADYCSASCRCDEGEGDCDTAADCASGLVCDQRSGSDFCLGTGCNSPVRDRDNGGRNYGVCEGDCDSDADCQSGLRCVQLERGDEVPGCAGTSVNGYDYCVRVSCL